MTIHGKVLLLSRRSRVNITMCKRITYYCYAVARNVPVPFHNCKVFIKSKQQQKTM